MSAHVAVMAAYVKYTHTNPGVFYFATIITFFPSRPVALVSELGLLGLARHLPSGLLLLFSYMPDSLAHVVCQMQGHRGRHEEI